MAKRVKALNERREQLKAGIVASTSKRRKNITNRNEMADKVRGFLASLKVLQDEPGPQGADQADAGRHPLEGPRLRRHLRALGAADRDRRPDDPARLRRWTISRPGARSRNTASSPAP
jgi:hypothetical protein